ncbi:MAG: hypothetical protein ACR2OI_08955, partial [Acidimicrobiia bacterium]
MTDSIIYEAEPIPPEDPEDGRRQRRRAMFGGAALIVLLLVAVVVGASLFSGNDEPEPMADDDQTQTSLAQTTTTLAGTTTPGRLDRSEGGGDAATYPARPGIDAPPTPPLPMEEFAWEMVTLEFPAGQDGWLQGVYAVDGGYLAFGISGGGADGIGVWRSDDGSAWEPVQTTGDFSGASVWNINFNEYGAVALGEEYEVSAGDGPTEFRPANPARLVWTSRDGINWARSELAFEAADNQSIWINTGVAGPGEFVVVGQRETSPEFEPMVFEKDGYTITLDEYTFTYKVED